MDLNSLTGSHRGTGTLKIPPATLSPSQFGLRYSNIDDLGIAGRLEATNVKWFAEPFDCTTQGNTAIPIFCQKTGKSRGAQGISFAPMEWFMLPQEETMKRTEVLKRLKSEKLNSFKASRQRARKMSKMKRSNSDSLEAVPKSLQKMFVDGIFCGRVKFFVNSREGYEIKGTTMQLPRYSRAPLYDRRQRWQIRTSPIGYHFPVAWDTFLDEMYDDGAIDSSISSRLATTPEMYAASLPQPPNIIQSVERKREVTFLEENRLAAMKNKEIKSNQYHEASLKSMSPNVQNKWESSLRDKKTQCVELASSSSQQQ